MIRRHLTPLLPLALLLAGCMDRELPTALARDETRLQQATTQNGGTLYFWGLGGLNTPVGDDFMAVAAGEFHSVALRADGTLISWGSDGDAQVRDTPTGSGFMAVAAGAFHSVALRADGTLISWGWDGDAQVRNTPTGSGFVAVAAGHNRSVALRADGTLISWGSDRYGEVRNTPTESGFVAVTAGRWHSVAIKTPPTPAQLLEALISLSASTPGISNGTQNKLLEARAHLSAGQIRPACNKLREYIDDVQSHRGKRISTADADALIARAQQIRSALSC